MLTDEDVPVPAAVGPIVPVSELDGVLTGRTAGVGAVSGLRPIGVDVVGAGGDAAEA